MSGSERIDDDAEIIKHTHRSGWSERLQSEKHEGTETVYDPIQPEVRWLTVPDSMWVEIEQ